MSLSGSTSIEEIGYLNERIRELSERGQTLRNRELKILDTVKYLLEKIQENQYSNYNKKITDIIMKYQQLQIRQRNLLEKTFVTQQNEKEFNDHELFLQETLEKITKYESKKEQMRENLESSFTANELQDDHFLFTLKNPLLEPE